MTKKTKGFKETTSFTAEVIIEFEDSKYKVKDLDLKKIKKNEKKKVKVKDSKFKITRLMAYFNVSDQNDIPLLLFDPNDPLIITINYPPDAWDQAVENNEKIGIDRPRVAYLARKKSGGVETWAEKWVEFTEHRIDLDNPDSISTLISTPPPTGGGDGKLEITVYQLPDPLIGGC